MRYDTDQLPGDLEPYRNRPAEGGRTWTRLDGRPLSDPPRRRLRPPPSAAPSVPLARAVGDSSIPLGSLRSCPGCGDDQVRRVTEPNAQGVTLYYWSDCRCILGQVAAQQRAVDLGIERLQARDARLLGDPGLERIADWTLDRFNPHLLAEVPIEGGGSYHPYTVVTDWYTRILDAPRATRGAGPEAALLLYSPGKGRGKSHLAAAMVHQARVDRKRFAFIEEQSYLSRYWNMPFGDERERLVALPGEQAWLTVFDDIGRRQPGRDASGIQNAWNDLISRRYAVGGWTIITSNYTLDELVARRTIDDASYSRLNEMTRGVVIEFAGADQRLRGGL